MNKYLDKNDRIFLLVAILIGSILFFVLKTIYNDTIRFDQNKLSFYVSAIGGIVTLIALTFTIHQQIKLKNTSMLIQENTEKLHTSIRNNYESWNLNRAVGLTNEIEDCLSKKEFKSSIILIRQLRELLIDCKKVFIVDFIQELNICVSCIDQESEKIDDLSKLIENCKEKCNIKSLEKIKSLNRKLAKQYVNINTGIIEDRKKINIQDCIKVVIDLRNELNEIKPNPITLNLN